jgi:anhydro-N-acetylmuramic acid kinase
MDTPLLAIGVMTGNSLDAADAVLTSFGPGDSIRDRALFRLPTPPALFRALKELREFVNGRRGDMDEVAGSFPDFDGVISAYMTFVASAVDGLLAQARLSPGAIDLIGFHGQTCAHLPPSVAGGAEKPYTVQVGDGQELANRTGITTVYDFRSDDLMAGGEGAPLAPMHNRHLAETLRATGAVPIAFLNGGNTSNIAHITYDADGDLKVAGWDAGPFNHFPDLLMRAEYGRECDSDGKIGMTGRIDAGLLRSLFDTSVITLDGKNFLLATPPKSSDPQWYRLISALGDGRIPLADRVRTVEYFSAYVLYHSLGHTAASLQLPARFAVFGGGWKNPVIFDHFAALIEKDFSDTPILPEHREWLAGIHARIHKSGTPSLTWSNHYGFDGQAMEARIFADMACCRVLGIPFTIPETTGAAIPTICGIIRYPHGAPANATANVRRLLQRRRSETLTLDQPAVFDGRWGRAAQGWQDKD